MDVRLSTLPVIHRQVQCVVENILALISLDMMSHRAFRRMAHIITTRGSLMFITPSVYLTTPGTGKKVSTTRGSLVLYTPSMRVPTSSRGRVT